MRSEWNVPPVELVFYPSARSRAVSSQLCLHKTIDYSVSNCFMNMKMKSNIINVETSFRHANNSAAFVSGRLLRFQIPKFHLIKVCRQSRKTFLFLFCFLLLLLRSADYVGRPFCFCSVSYYFFLLLRFPTLVGNLSVFVLSFLIILYSLFFIFLLSFPHHSPFITSSIFNRLTSNFQQMFRMTRLLLLLNFNEISPGVGTGRCLQI